MPATIPSDPRAAAAVAIVLARRRARVDDEAIQDAIRAKQDAQAARSASQASFRTFLRHWHFISRETGQMLSFANLWPGQEEFVKATEQSTWVYGLKAGKLGFTELECAFDVWRAIFAHPYARVSLLSKDMPASKSLLSYVKFGLRHLPSWFGIKILAAMPGGDTTQSVAFTADWFEEGDYRLITSYAATGTVAIDQSFAHAHVDELSHMQDGKGVWSSISTLVEPQGTCHVVTRGAGDMVYSYELWQHAKAGTSKLLPFFVPWTGRSDRDRTWYEQEAGNMSHLALAHYAPETEEDALMGDDVSPYIPIERWDALADDLEPLRPGNREPVVLAVDSAVTSDFFAIVAVTRHPRRPAEAAIRQCWVWKPSEFADKRIDFEQPKRLLRLLTTGGCVHGHPRAMPDAQCQKCIDKNWELSPLNVVQVTYDPHQLEPLIQDLKREMIAWFDEFDQGGERLVGDAGMFRMALAGTLHWARPMPDNDLGMKELREHIRNSKAKLQPDQESSMRIVKRSAHGKIDAAVAAAMATKRIMELNL